MCLAEHLISAPGNATYTSGQIQNELIDIIGRQIRQYIASRVQQAKWFTVIADEVTDASNKQQLSLVVRFEDVVGIIRQDFVDFIACDEGLTGEQVSVKILNGVTSLGLDPANLRGQCYDGAGNICGPVKGAACRITEQHTQATYLHCVSHCHNLVVVSSL